MLLISSSQIPEKGNQKTGTESTQLEFSSHPIVRKMRFAHSLGLLFGLASLVLATPISGKEYTKRAIPSSWANHDDPIAKRQFGYRYGDRDRDEDRHDRDRSIGKRQFNYGYGPEPNETDLSKPLPSDMGQSEGAEKVK